MHFDGDVYDSSGNALHGTWQGSAQYAPGTVNQAIDLSVSMDNYVMVDSDDRLGGMEQLTISLWAKKNNPDAGGTLIKKHVQYSISIGRNFVETYVANENGVLGRANVYRMNAISDTEWHNYALSYNGSAVELFIDGVKVSDAPLSGNVRPNNAYSLFIGKNPWGGSFEGQIDELVISTDELVALKHVVTTSLNYHYPLLSQNYPNPFNKSTTIEYQIPGLEGNNDGVKVQITVYNIFGQRVRELMCTHQSPGIYKVTWNGLDDNGNEVATGYYMYQIKASTFKITKKMIFFK